MRLANRPAHRPRPAAGPLGLRPWPELAVDIDMLDRTGSSTSRSASSTSPRRPARSLLSDLVDLRASSSGGPLDRIDRVPTAAVEVRLPCAADGDAVRREINQLELPPGFVVAEGGELPDMGPESAVTRVCLLVRPALARRCSGHDTVLGLNPWPRRIGIGLSVLPVAMLLFSASAKLGSNPEAVAGFKAMGYPDCARC